MKPSMFEFVVSPDFAGEMDTLDPLKGSRENFFIPTHSDGGEVIYFTGNSLGLQPRTVRGHVEQELKDSEKYIGMRGTRKQKPWWQFW